MPAKRLNEQVKRNGYRFPVDFLFQLTAPKKQEMVENCSHLAREIVDDLEAALEQLREITEDLEEKNATAS